MKIQKIWLPEARRLASRRACVQRIRAFLLINLIILGICCGTAPSVEETSGGFGGACSILDSGIDSEPSDAATKLPEPLDTAPVCWPNPCEDAAQE